MSRIEVCCEMVAVLWLRQDGYLVDTLSRVVSEPEPMFRSADDEKVAKWLVDHEGYTRRKQ